MRGASVVLGVAVLLATAAPAHARTRAHAAPAFAVPFIEDDYARALASARAKHVPIFVEAWAPW